jgi:hypothetical protein
LHAIDGSAAPFRSALAGALHLRATDVGE